VLTAVLFRNYSKIPKKILLFFYTILLLKQVEFLEEKVAGMNISDFSIKMDHRKTMNAPVKVLPMPDIKGGRSKEVPCVRDDVKLAYSEDKGRYLVATQDIPPGKILKRLL
jgi:hypothetical protein